MMRHITKRSLFLFLIMSSFVASVHGSSSFSGSLKEQEDLLRLYNASRPSQQVPLMPEGSDLNTLLNDALDSKSEAEILRLLELVDPRPKTLAETDPIYGGILRGYLQGRPDATPEDLKSLEKAYLMVEPLIHSQSSQASAPPWPSLSETLSTVQGWMGLSE